MNTFLPYSCFKESAQSLDRQRLGKQRVECLQILKCLEKGPIFNQKKTPWYNHPAVQMWKNHESYLVIYGRIICKEWLARGYKDTCYEKIDTFYSKFKISADKPSWLGSEKFHLAHKSALIRKKPDHYRPLFGLDVPDNLEYIWPV